MEMNRTRADMSRTSDVWWKNAIFYCLDVETFQDSDGDGIGDFAGLEHRIDYLAGLGTSPASGSCRFSYPTRKPRRRLTTSRLLQPSTRGSQHGDLVANVPVRTAHIDRGIRSSPILRSLTTPRAHPSVSGRPAPTARPYRDWYALQTRSPSMSRRPRLFECSRRQQLGMGRRKRGQYYLTTAFYKHQPDLNIEQPSVRTPVSAKIIGSGSKSAFRVPGRRRCPSCSRRGPSRGQKPTFVRTPWLRICAAFIGAPGAATPILMGEVQFEIRRRPPVLSADEGGTQ